MKPKTQKLKLIDLCAGTGAFSHAFEKTGSVEVVFANDLCKASKHIYDNNFGHDLLLKDLNDIDVKDIPPHDIMTAGFPCQPFSICGKQAGFDDARSNIFWKLMEIVDHHKPKCLVFENVKNLASHDSGKTFRIIKKSLIKRGYKICYNILNTSTITKIPQHRERIYIVCFRDKKLFDIFDLDFDDQKKDPISKILEKNVDKKYYYSDKLKVWDLVESSVIKKNTIYQYRRVYVRENKNNECPTLTANMGTGGHNVPLIKDNKGIRKLTPRECFNLQGFPKTYNLQGLSDAKLYKLAGNAVSVPVVELVANRLVPLLV